MKRIISNISLPAILCAVLLATGACQKPFRMSVPLGTDKDEMYVPSTAGKQYILVWATSAWSAAFETPVDWATLEKVDNGSISGLYVKYTENQAISRGVNIVITAGDHVKKVYFAQKAGMSAPMFIFDQAKVSVLKPSKTMTVSTTTNLSGTDIAKAVFSVTYSGTDTDWISGMRLDGRNFIFEIAENGSGEDRTAIIAADIPGAFAGEGAGSSITVNQAKEGPQVSFAEQEISLDGLSASLNLGYSINFDPALYTEYAMNYGFRDEAGAAVDWIKNPERSDAAIKARVRVNQNAPRTAFAYIDIVRQPAAGSAGTPQTVASATMKISQSVTTATIADGDGDQQIKDPEEDF